MGVLTIDMQRLRGQIDAAHGLREALMQDLARGTRELKRDVDAMLTGFHASNLQMAKRTHHDCATFLAGVDNAVNHIRTTVASLKKDFASDIRGARRAWRGSGADRRAKPAARHGAGSKGKRS
jgi:uncharacterized protein YukE